MGYKVTMPDETTNKETRHMTNNKKYGMTTLVTLENADFLVPFLEKQMSEDIINKMTKESLNPLCSPRTFVEHVFVEDETNGEIYEAKKIMCWCYY